METKNETQKTIKQALTTFVLLAAVVFAVSLAYCYITEHFMEMGVVSGAVILLAVLIFNLFQSIKKS